MDRITTNEHHVFLIAILCQSVDRLRCTQKTHKRAWASARPQVAGHPFNTVQVREYGSPQRVSRSISGPTNAE